MVLRQTTSDLGSWHSRRWAGFHAHTRKKKTWTLGHGILADAWAIATTPKEDPESREIRKYLENL